jgi:hypothetical protein
VATAGVAAAALFGTMVVILAVFGVDVLRSGFLAGPPGSGPSVAGGSTAAGLLVGGTFGGFVLAGILAWWLLAPIGSLYPRTALAVCSSFATVVLMLIGQPVHQLFGQRGLLAFAALLAAGAAVFARKARRAAQNQ